MGYIIKGNIKYSMDPDNLVTSLNTCKTLSDADKKIKFPCASIITTLEEAISEIESNAKKISIYTKNNKIYFKSYEGNESVINLNVARKVNSNPYVGDKSIDVAAKGFTNVKVDDFIISIVEIPGGKDNTFVQYDGYKVIWADPTKLTEAWDETYNHKLRLAKGWTGNTGWQQVSGTSTAYITDTVTPTKKLSKDGVLTVTNMSLTISAKGDGSKDQGKASKTLKMQWNLYYVPEITTA